MSGATPAALSRCGTIEGFYGPPWTHDQRLEHLRFCAQAGFDTYVYAPKDDPFHRRRWRELYPGDQLARIAELCSTATALGVRFVYALHPALSMRYAEGAEHERLAAKAEQLYGAGVREFMLLFDDVPMALSDPEDVVIFGPDAGAVGAAHGEAVRRFLEGFIDAHGLARPLLVCPTDYAGTAASDYRDGMARTAPEDIVIAWTGSNVVVGAVTRADIDAAAASYRRPLLLWDNFPVNDFEPSRLFLGPLLGRTADVAGSALVGVIANAMIQPAPSRIPLATVARWARDPAGYEPVAALASALALSGAEALAPFVRVCSTWPPSADQDPDLTAATRTALADESNALDLLEARFDELARCCRDAAGPAELVAELRPWLDGALATSEAALAAVGLLRALASGAPATEQVSATRTALDRAEEHYENVLRPVVAPFVRAALDRAAPVVEDADRPVALILSGADEAIGARATADFVREQGWSVTTDGPVEAAALVVVTRSAPASALDAVATAPVPVIAWGGLVELGMASESSTAMLWEGVDIVDPADALAAGLTGRVPLYRGPAYVGVADVGPGARVVVQGPDQEDRVVAFRYETGAPLVDGTPAPGPRIGLFLTQVGPARWLLDATGWALLGAALDLVSAGSARRS